MRRPLTFPHHTPSHVESCYMELTTYGQWCIMDSCERAMWPKDTMGEYYEMDHDHTPQREDQNIE